MARLTSNSIFGPVSGTLGGFVFSNRNGKGYVQTKRVRVSKPSSPGQLEHKAKFRAVVQFLQPVKDFLHIGFKAQAKRKKMSTSNAAMSYHFKNALVGSYPECEIDFSKALLSKGNLSGAKDAAVSLLNTGEIEFTWKDCRDEMYNDHVMVAVYNLTKKEAAIVTRGTLRTEEHLTIPLPPTFAGDEVHCYIAFQNAAGSDVSDSQYLGSLRG